MTGLYSGLAVEFICAAALVLGGNIVAALWGAS